MKLIGVTLILLAVHCTAPIKQFSESEKANTEKEVADMLQQYCEDIRLGGFLAELKYLHDDSTFYWVPPGFSGPIGYDSIVTIITNNAPAYKYVDNRWEELKVTALTPDHAIYTGRLQSHMTDTSGVISHARLMETGIVIKKYQQWKLHAGHTSPIR